ncbi:MAG: hypothetical protein LBQ87_05970 [Candidatus Fibromonas sp.]|jgi:hypothetical protein|nr:hypothetical protein [Candidatus Fibromonas sp.]
MAVWFITFLAIAFIIAAAGAKQRAARRYDLPLENPALSLAILKENLLENPSEGNLQKLKEFAASQNILLPKGEYPLGKAPSIEQDDTLFLSQASWLDSLVPLEFNEEPKTEKSLINGILRLYSDEAIFNALEELSKKFPSEAQQKLELDYHKLCELRDNSKADYNSLEKLRMEKEKWEQYARAYCSF